MSNFVSVDEKGDTSLDFQKAADAGAMGQIKEYREEVLKVGESTVSTIKRTIKLHDRAPAIGLLLKLHGLLAEKHDHTSGGKPLYKVIVGVSDDDM